MKYTVIPTRKVPAFVVPQNAPRKSWVADMFNIVKSLTEKKPLWAVRFHKRDLPVLPRSAASMLRAYGRTKKVQVKVSVDDAGISATVNPTILTATGRALAKRRLAANFVKTPTKKVRRRRSTTPLKWTAEEDAKLPGLYTSYRAGDIGSRTLRKEFQDRSIGAIKIRYRFQTEGKLKTSPTVSASAPRIEAALSEQATEQNGHREPTAIP